MNNNYILIKEKRTGILFNRIDYQFKNSDIKLLISDKRARRGSSEFDNSCQENIKVKLTGVKYLNADQILLWNPF